MQNRISLRTSDYVLDSRHDYTENDWLVENNCALFDLYKKFATEIWTTNNDLLQERNFLDDKINAKHESVMLSLLETFGLKHAGVQLWLQNNC